MSYIGRGIDQIDNISTLDNLSFNGSSTTFNLTQNSVAFVPVSADALQIQIDGIIQSGNYSISGSTVTFNFTPSGSSVCNGIKHFGVGVAFTPSSGSVTKDKTNFVSTSSSAGLEIKGDGTTDGTLQLNCSQNSHGIKIKSAPHSANASYTLTLPNTDGNADQVLKTDGSGVLDWTTPSGGGLVLISSGNGTNSASLQLESVFTSTYTNYLFVGTFKPSTNAVDLQGNYVIGTTVKTANEYVGIGRSWLRNTSSVSQGNSNGWGDGHMRFSSASSSSNDNYGQNVNMFFYNPLATSSTNTPAHPHILFDAVNWADDNQIVRTSGAVNYNQTGNYNGFRWIYSSGNINFYNYSLFGITGS